MNVTGPAWATVSSIGAVHAHGLARGEPSAATNALVACSGFKGEPAQDERMEYDIHINVADEATVEDAVVVLGTPTLGQVGTITAHYIIDELDMERVGDVHSIAFPPIALVEQGRPGAPLRLYARETPCGLGLSCERLVVITGEALPNGTALNRVADELATWCVDNGAEIVVLPDGALVEGEGEERAVRGVTTSEDADALREKLDVEAMEGGMMRGFSASFLVAADRRGLDAMAVLAQTTPKMPDARAAARIVELLDPIVPDIKLEPEPLREKAEAIEERVQAVRRQAKQQSRQQSRRTGAGAADPMVN